MKIPKYIWAGLIVAAVFSGACSRKNSNSPTVNRPAESNATNSTVQSLTNPPAVMVSNNIPANSVPAVVSNTNISAPTDLDSEYEKYQKGQITKGQMMRAIWAADNQTPQSLYGKVVDQYGQPVGGADVTGSIELIQGFDVGEKFETHKTKTDFEGLFQFTGLKGARLDASVEKKGYQIDYRVGRSKSGEATTSPDDRAIFTMWKLKGPELMVHVKAQAGIACDGSPMVFDLLTGKKNPGGDLIVKLTRNPVNIVRGKSFDWSITLEIPNGGLQDITDLYPNEAPSKGYQPTITMNFPTNMPKWTAWVDHSFYFTSRGGQVYGRMNVSITADFQPPPTFFSAEVFANPAGSRNLELDPAKVTRSH